MRNIKLTLAFDGSRYRGWQRLGDDANTIQGRLEAVLGRMTGEKIALTGCGRTDAGVHALRYVANFNTHSGLPVTDMLNYCYHYLPEDIVVQAVEEVPQDFHARFHVRAKTYLYRIDNRPRHDVFARRYSWHLPDPLDVESMRLSAQPLLGRHDFQSFTRAKPGKKSTVRTLNAVEIVQRDGLITLSFTGDGFLWHMARILTGTLVEAGYGRFSPEQVCSALEAKQRAQAGPLAPAKGLFLADVIYRD
ncbi:MULTISPECIES: tRNA pseudouridine(38-40) synthase TruA [unclassified Clostridium]|uniref:tRNA pseudouridine(38-40) synthase TruA n=1 Tax=unclassified Clostridium TaxID=2614128 RepID=UPI0011075CEE|nr:MULTISPECIES: tRNA pseudouridine(38-40) synthase TruA [unclassified Clostridium]